MMHLLHDIQIDRYFSRGLRPDATVAVLRRVWQCAACRARYERHLLFESALPVGEGRRDDRLWRTIRGSVGDGSGATPARRVTPWFRRWAFLAASGAVALVVFASQHALNHRASPSTSRGPAVEIITPPVLHLFRTTGDHQTEAVDKTIRTNDGILIAYSNPRSDLGYLMVFAVDEHGNVYWYYPAYEQPGENPSAAPIRTGALGIELGEEIRHPLPTGALRIFGLFLPRPWQVDRVERLVAQAFGLHGGSLESLVTLPITEGEQTSRLLQVTP